MKNFTSVDVRCAREIPFKKELISFLSRVFKGQENDVSPDEKLRPKQTQILDAVRDKPIYIHVRFSRAVQSVRPMVIRSVRKFFRRELVAVIKESDSDFTLVFV